MTAADEIRHLLYRYAELIDAGEFDGLGELFEEATVDWGNETTEGGAAVVDRMTSFTRRYEDGTPRTAHIITNVIVEFESDTSASARSRYTVMQAAGSLGLQPIICGRYEDEFRCLDDTWRFSRRRYIVDLVGDLSAHLPEALARHLER